MNLLLTVTFKVKDTTRPTLPVLGQVHIVSVHGFPVGIRGDGHFDFYVFTLVLPDFITIGKTVPSLTDLREIQFWIFTISVQIQSERKGGRIFIISMLEIVAYY